ncbi:nucleoside/nucleotide kinase family protein [Kineococcus aurantiacus]|uniref:Pantothenate kinase n=1 Tax=Kineococcus aurantiacus TaxID=37633 RepID=A0A7Y9J297_9ACTN|nr:nucleoside/nucleotide kinase family protein [Kineococcus aurantiacus]NYD23828.1 pantothenate kinase [Kineococcus aurantiacus]
MAYPELLERARALASGPRRVLGLVGAPGAGKSTLAARLAADLGPQLAVVVPLDGFHYADVVLGALGRRERKGAPDTFDVGGYVALLRRLRSGEEDVVHAPEFRRDLEEPVGSALPVPREVPLVITEGNYLLLREGPWAALEGLLDETWYLRPAEDVRRERLVARHEAYGKDPAAARAWALGSDEANAAVVAAAAHRADRVVDPG